MEPSGGFSSKPPWRTAPVRGCGSAALRALPRARCWDPDQHHGQCLPRPPRNFQSQVFARRGKLGSEPSSRQALGGWAVEGIHVNPPLTSLRTVTLQLGSTQTQERRLHPPWRLLQLGVPIHPKPTRSCRLSYKIRSTSVPSTPAEAPRGDPKGLERRRRNLLLGRRSQRRGGREGGWTPSRELAHKIVHGPRPWVAGDQLPFSKAP